MRIFVLLVSLILHAHAATVSMLDGRVLHADALHFDAKTGSVMIDGSTLALAECDWIEPGSGAGVATGRITNGVWLVDGSWMPVDTIEPALTDNALLVKGPLGALTLPLAAVRGWSTGLDLPGSGAGAGVSDQVQLDSGVVAGRVDGIISGKLIFHSSLDRADDKAMELELSQVRALRLASANKNSKGVRLSVSLDEAHPPLKVVPASNGSLALAVAPTVLLGAALNNARLRSDGGQRVYLSDLTPANVEETGAFGVVWPWQRDHGLDGGPIRLGGVRHERGLTVHSKAALTWKLAGDYARLHALAGIADAVADQGDCAVTLLADDTSIWTRNSVKGSDKPILIDVDLSGVQQLALRVDYGTRYDIGDHFVLADAFLVRRADK